VNTEPNRISVSGIWVEIVRKGIKNLHLGVYPPHGRVRVAAPITVSDNAVRMAVIGKLGWIKRQQARFEGQPRQSAPEMVSGESHYFLGRRYRLRVVFRDGPGQVALLNKPVLEVRVRPGASAVQRGRVLQAWYRQQLKRRIPPLLEKWQRVMGVQAAECRIKRMKTKWGTCSVEAGRIWLNLELAKKPLRCIEYVLVHELGHLIERHHSDRFIATMDRHLPQWRALRRLLNAAPLSHDEWTY
jgi:predicted metal-dependent hydrolase